MAYILSILTALSLMANAVETKEDYKDWRKRVSDRLESEEGWLTVVGLFWLKEGKNTIGSDFKNDLRLPKRAADELGYITKKGDKYTLHLKDPKSVKVDGKVAKAAEIPLKTDTSEKFTSLEHKGINFFLITRKNGTALRVKDPKSEARRTFKGRRWFDVNKDYVIQGQWVAYRSPKTMIVPDVIGNMNKEMVPGVIKFKFKGNDYELSPTSEGDDLFIVFKDETSGKSTYGRARFLYTRVNDDGTVTLDFNKAVNPPCAFTDFATCPSAPKENTLSFAVNAGELPPK